MALPGSSGVGSGTLHSGKARWSDKRFFYVVQQSALSQSEDNDVNGVMKLTIQSEALGSYGVLIGLEIPPSYSSGTSSPLPANIP